MSVRTGECVHWKHVDGRRQGARRQSARVCANAARFLQKRSRIYLPPHARAGGIATQPRRSKLATREAAPGRQPGQLGAETGHLRATTGTGQPRARCNHGGTVTHRYAPGKWVARETPGKLRGAATWPPLLASVRAMPRAPVPSLRARPFEWSRGPLRAGARPIVHGASRGFKGRGRRALGSALQT